MTVKELKAELECYDDDAEIVFEVNDDFEPESVTEDRWCNREVHLDAKVHPSFIGTVDGDMWVDLSLVKKKVRIRNDTRDKDTSKVF